MEGIRLRSYQQEMLVESLRKNVIVAMDTGSGKTHVAVSRILAELERTDSNQLVWFLSPSVALALQQAQVLSENLAAYHVRTLTGLDGVDKWTDQKLWDAILLNLDVVVATPAVLLDGLTHGFIKLERISLCVFDEAHRATKGHPMNAILQRFYHPAKQLGQHTPHILGLSASPVVNSKHGNLEKIEANLDARAVTPKQHRSELEKFVNPPQFVTVPYTGSMVADFGSSDRLCCALAQIAKTYDLDSDPYVLELREQDDERSRKQLAKIMCNRKTYCSEQLRALDLRALTLEKELGPSMAHWYVSTCIAKFQESLAFEGTLVLPDLLEKERKHLATIFESLQPLGKSTQVQGVDGTTDLLLSHKAEQLIEILRKIDTSSVRGIVFVEQRAQVTALAHLLSTVQQVAPLYRIGSFVGTSSSTYRKQSVADLTDLKEQQRDLEAFRKGEKNLIIATTVLEEGIDVSACNLVICFEPPKNLVSFVQRRGRARQQDSKYFLFIAEDDPKRNSQKWSDLEASMKAAYMDEARQLAEHLDDDLEISDSTYHVPSTGALLTFENAKSHLYHFCSVGTLQSSQFVDLRPEFETHQDPSTGEWAASVDLPAFVHPSLRYASSSRAWKSESMAIKEAAFEAYIALHKAGLINDNLLPLVKDYGPDPGQQHLNQPSLVEVPQRKSSWRDMWSRHTAGARQWYSSRVSIALDGQIIVQMVLWTPDKMTSMDTFQLFWNPKVTYDVTFHSIDQKTVNMDELLIVRECTGHILRSVHSSRMTGDDDFAMLMTPGEDFSWTWLDSIQGELSATDANAHANDPMEVGLVRVKGQTGHPFFFHGIQASGQADVSAEVVASTFPKRKDFLHPIPQGNLGAMAFTGRQGLRASECTIDKLPAKFALFSAFVPSIMHRLDVDMLAQELDKTLLQSVGIHNNELLVEAISSPAAGEAKDYNRLEYLGDSVLKHCTELQVISQHPCWPESFLTVERDRIVRNTNLANAAMDMGLDKYVLSKVFTGAKWKPLYVSQLLASTQERREMSTKTLADVVEALIGAAYVDGGFDKAFKCIKTLLSGETWNTSDECLSALVGDIGSTDYKNIHLLERLIGHSFNHPALFVEAITHASFSSNCTGLSYERLEFLGDSVLDMLVTPQLFAHPRRLKHWELHRAHEALVNSHFLGYCCLRYVIHTEKCDIVADDVRQEIETSSRPVHLRDFLRAGRPLMPLRQQAIARFEKLQPEIEQALEHGDEYPWSELMALNPPKFFCDLVESILGAIFIDTRGDLGICEAFAEKLGILKYMRRLLEEHVETINPKERLGVVADQDEVKYVNGQQEDENEVKSYSCTVRVGNEDVVTVSHCGSRDEAEVKAARQACKQLEGRPNPTEAGRLKRKLEVSATDEDEDADMEDEVGIDTHPFDDGASNM
ncbi:Dicer 2 [Lecanosticta acicola]|uniref:Dicer 2 n=1 Tax=Lecanosticta acicola TaxID=111012 RepID=A0AAI8Z020_9PEZI|nr:Dicer 2 [Lecanosticta acicola]